ncbi:50S ribosomal protein L24 [Rickettsiales bacterium (ex Bugula neritina AB1)]|nr:50S ribosomal protein L24 [Rickettsiales bacterium (ex Bugula neritina AB1)]
MKKKFKPHVALGATVVVITGKEKRKIGKVIEINKNGDKVKVEKLCMMKHFVKKNKDQEGGIIESEGWIHISNVSNITKDGHITKVRSIKNEEGYRVFISKKDNSEVFKVGNKQDKKLVEGKKIKLQKDNGNDK